MLLSGCIITKNAQDFLKPSIESYIKYVDELIVVDDKSTDNTINICKSFGSKVKIYVRDFKQNKKKQRQFYVNQAKGRWIFCPDSDEVYLKKDMEWFIKTIKNNPDLLTMGVQLVNFWKSFDKIIKGGVYDGIMQRMFRNNGVIGYHDLHHTVSWKPGTILFKYAIEQKQCIPKAFQAYHYSYLKDPKYIKEKIAYYMRRDNPNCKNEGGVLNDYLVDHFTELHPYFSNRFDVERYGNGGLYCCGIQKGKAHYIENFNYREHPEEIKRTRFFQEWVRNKKLNYDYLGR